MAPKMVKKFHCITPVAPPHMRMVAPIRRYQVSALELAKKLQVIVEEREALEKRVAPPADWGKISFSKVVSTKAAHKCVKSHTFSGLIPKIIVTPPPQPKRRVVRPAQRFAHLDCTVPKQYRGMAPWTRAYWEEVDAGMRPFHYGRHLLKDLKSFKKLWVLEHNIQKAPKKVVPEPEMVRHPAQPTGYKGSGSTPKTPKCTFHSSALWKEGETIPYVDRLAHVDWAKIVELKIKLQSAIEKLEELRKRKVAHPLILALERKAVKKAAYVLKKMFRKEKRPELKKFEMEQPDSEQVNITCVTAGDATIPQAPNPSEALIKRPIIRRRLLNMASSRGQEKIPLTDSWISLETVEWNSTHKPEEQYWEYKLPYVALARKELPQVLPFLVHQYANFDMEVQISLTGLAWARGLLIASWYYHPELDANYSTHRRSRASMIQRDHVLINASIENSAILKIPFSSYMSSLPLVTRADACEAGNLGTLIITPFNALAVADGQLSSIQFTVNVRFIDALLYGKSAVSVGSRPYLPVKETQMLPMLAIMAAQRLLNSIEADPNRDKPPYQGPASIMTPQTTSNLAMGTNYVEAVQAMRLDARGQTPHPDLTTECSTWQSIASRKGYIKTFQIKRDTKATTVITEGCLDACPMLELSQYSQFTIDGQKAYNFPPIAVVSSLFGKWRGSIIYEFEFVSAPAHHLEVLVAYVPRYLDTITYTQAIGCLHQVFKLTAGGPRTFEFEAPFVSPTPFWDRRFSTGIKVEEVSPPGRIHFFVRTQLVYTNVVTKEIDVNVYMRAGSDFEVAIPVQPSLGLSFDPFGPHDDPSKKLVMKPGYTWFNVDSWSSASVGDKPMAVARYGNGGQHVCQAQLITGKDPEPRNYYSLTFHKYQQSAAKHRFKGNWKLSPVSLDYAPYFMVPLNIGDSHGFQYMTIAVSNLQLLYFFFDISEAQPRQNPRQFIVRQRESPNYDYATVLEGASVPFDLNESVNFYWEANDPLQLDAQKILQEYWGDKPLKESISVEEWESFCLEDLIFPDSDTDSDSRPIADKVVEGNDELRDQPQDLCATRYSTQIMQSANLLYGESFHSVKDLCRRWQPFRNLDLTIDLKQSKNMEIASFKIPLLPAGLALQARTNHSSSLIRDGVIPITNSFFRFFRGGLRFKFIFSTISTCNVVYWVQHRPDRRVTSDRIELLTKNAMDGIYCHNYATSVQSMNINPTITIEVPYYLRGPLGLLQRPAFNTNTDNEAFSLGELVVGYTVIGATSFQSINIPVNIMWSVSDDFSPYLPIGFPAMVTLGQFEADSLSRHITDKFKAIQKKGNKKFEMSDLEPPTPEKEEEVKEGTSTDVNTVKEVENEVEPTVVVQEAGLFSRILKYLTGVDLTQLKESLLEMSSVGFERIDADNLMFMIASQIFHIVATPNATHVWIAFFTILIYLGIMTFDKMTSLMTSVRKVFAAIGITKKHSEVYTDDGSLSNIVTTLYMCIATCCNLKLKDFTPRTADIQKIVKVFQTNCKSAQSVVSTLTALFEVFRSFVTNIVYYIKNITNIVRWKFIKPDVIDEYIMRATEMLHPRNEERIMTRLDGYLDVDIAYEQGATLLRDTIKFKNNSTPLSTILEMQRKLGSLRDRAARMGCGASHRRAPFCIHVTGKPGIGKSQITVPVINALLDAAKISYGGQSTWHLQHGMKYWDGLYSQPALLKDELCPMQDVTMMVEELSYFQMLMSCAPFIRPGAAIEDKGRTYCPEIVWLNSNVAYPAMDCVRDRRSIFRRYSILWECELSDKAAVMVGEQTGDAAIQTLKNFGVDVDNFEHLRFKRKVNPENENCKMWHPPIVFQEFINETFKEMMVYRQNQFHLLDLYQQKRIKVTVDPPQVEDKVIDRNELEISDTVQQVRQEIQSTFKEEVAETTKEGIKLVAPAQIVNRAIITPQIKAMRRRRIMDLRTGVPSIPSKVSEVGPEVPVPGLSTVSATALLQTPEEVEKLVAVYIARSRMNKTKELQKKRVTTNHVYVLKPIDDSRIPISCPHRFDKMWTWLYDEHSQEYYDCADPNKTYSKHCAGLCVATDAELGSELYKNLSAASDYWRYLLYSHADLIKRNSFLQEYNAKRIISEVHAVLDKEMTWRTKLMSLAKFVGIICIPLTFTAFVWGLTTLDKQEKEFHTRQVAAVCDALKVRTVNKNEEVSPAQYSGKTLNGSKRSGVLRRAPEPILVKTSQIESSIVQVNDTVLYPLNPKERKNSEMQTEILSNIILNNTRFMIISGYSEDNKVTRRQCRVLGICDRYIVFPHHYIYEWNKLKYEDRIISIYHLGQYLEVESFDWKNLHQIEGTDLVIYRLGAKFPNFKDIRAHLSTYDILESGISRKGIFYEVIPKLEATKGQILNITPITMNFADAQNVECKDMIITLQDGIVYPEVHGAGKCGGVIVDTHNGKISGMHIAGDSKEGMSSFLVRDWFDNLKGVLTPVALEESNPDYIDLDAHPTVFLEGTFIEGGIVTNELAHRETGKTSIIPSEIAGVFPVVTEPVILSSKDPRANGQSPMKLNMEKHGAPFTRIPPEIMDEAVADYRELVNAKVKPLVRPVQPLSLQQAIMGDKDSYPGLKPIEMSTSEGFPFISKRPKSASSKAWLFEFEESPEGKKLIGLHQELQFVLNKKQWMRENGMIPQTVFTDCLKDERKKTSKIAPNKTRIFSISPIDYTIQCRQYFAPFFQAFENAGLEMEHAIGIAVQREDWTSLVNYMLGTRGGKSKSHACGDYTAFGDTLDATLVTAALEIATDWLYEYESKDLGVKQAEINRTIRHCLSAELKNATHLTFNLLVQTMCGMPSGCPLTVYLNTMVNSMYMRCAWLKVFEKYPDIRYLDQFKKYVRIVTYGDDVWLCISNEIIDLFNNRTISEAFKEFGIKYTDISKDGNIRESCRLDEVVFLKNKIIPHPTRKGKYLASLDLTAVQDCVNWIHKCADERAASLEVSYSSLLLAYGHGPDYYNEHLKKLSACWSAHGVQFQGRRWESLDDQFYREEIPIQHLAEFPIASTPHQDRALIYARARAAYEKLQETRAG